MACRPAPAAEIPHDRLEERRWIGTRPMSTTGWTQGRVDALLAALDTYGMVMSRAAAEDLISERVDAVAQLMRTTKSTARHYLTDAAIAGMAESIAFSLAEESPGAQLYDAPRTAPVPLYYVGRMVAGLAEACQVRFAERDDPEHAETRVTELVKCLSILGSITSTEPPHDDVTQGTDGSAGITVAFPPALLRRIARYLDAAAVAAEDGAAPAGFDEDSVKLARVFRDDATMLRILAEAGGPSGRPNLGAL